MKNAVQQFIEKLENLVNEFKGMKEFKVKKKAEIGNEFELLGITWKIIDITEKGCLCLAEKLENKMQYDSTCNDWRVSNLRKYLNTEFYKKLSEEVGVENIAPFERNLLSLDGQTEYETCEDKVSLLTIDEYRRYRKQITNTNRYWWWLLSPYSTKSNGDETWCTVGSPSGNIGNDLYYNDLGVRPFCILKSSIFESEE